MFYTVQIALTTYEIITLFVLLHFCYVSTVVGYGIVATNLTLSLLKTAI
jgi:hypothetical protein